MSFWNVKNLSLKTVPTSKLLFYAIYREQSRFPKEDIDEEIEMQEGLIEMYEELQRELFDDNDYDEENNSVTFEENESNYNIDSIEINNPCPVCGEELTFEGGCNICKNCGWSKCD